MILGGWVVPHGDFCFDPSLVDFANGSLQLHDGAASAAEAIAQLQPGAILLITPHGMESDNFLFYGNNIGYGYADVGGDLHNASHPTYRVNLTSALEPSMTAQLSNVLRRLHLNVSNLLAFGNGLPEPLGWGEVLPMKFLEAAFENSGTRVPPLSILSLPSRRYNFTRELVNSGEIYEVGRVIGNFLESSKQRVALVVSADLAHTHSADGPYGYSNASEPFDRACGAWMADFNSADGVLALTVTAVTLADRALSCGFTGLVLLESIIRGIGLSPLRDGLKADVWKSRIIAGPFHPTYYGMMVGEIRRTS